MPTREDVKIPARNKPGDSSQTADGFCLQCGTRDLRIRRRSFFQRLFSVVLYECGRCDYRQTGFKFSFVSLVTPLLIGALAYGAWVGATKYWFHGDESTTANADALARARTSPGALSTFELMMLKKPRATMDNAAVLKLVKANVSLNIITQMIRNSNADFDLTPGAVIDLKQQGVDQTIILAMMDATYNVR